MEEWLLIVAFKRSDAPPVYGPYPTGLITVSHHYQPALDDFKVALERALFHNDTEGAVSVLPKQTGKDEHIAFVTQLFEILPFYHPSLTGSLNLVQLEPAFAEWMFDSEE